MVLTLELSFRLTTPAFVSGADPLVPAIRGASLRGLFRFWLRAVDHQYRDTEPSLFGSAGRHHGQSRVLVRVTQSHAREPYALSQDLWRRFDEAHPSKRQVVRNGIKYLGFPLFMRGGERRAIPADHPFGVTLHVPRPKQIHERERRALLGALWTMGRIGGLGTRSRRGFGGLHLQDWRVEGSNDWSDDLRALPIAPRSAEEWREGWTRGHEIISRWLGTPPDGGKRDLPHVGPKTRVHLSDAPHRGREAWAPAMNEAGRALQDFRQFSAPDYADVKDHLARRRPLEHPPSRATFGLPLAFRYRSLEGASAMFLPAPKGKKAGDRHPSLLFIKIVALGDTRAALFVRLDGAVPGDRGFGVVVRSPAPLVGPKTNALDDFMTSLESRPRGHR